MSNEHHQALAMLGPSNWNFQQDNMHPQGMANRTHSRDARASALQSGSDSHGLQCVELVAKDGR
eukprot:352629-Amphidinium_carterae.1